MSFERIPCPAHRAALAAVARISFTLAGLGAATGCIVESPTTGEADDRADGEAADAIADGDLSAADVMVDGGFDAQVPDPDGGADAAPDGGADAVVWSETTPCPSPAEDHDAWLACCAAKGWDWEDPNCAAWGPPMPPRMLA